jgi:hypothetical protein
MSNSQIIRSNCVFCNPDEKSETIIICQVCKDKIELPKTYVLTDIINMGKSGHMSKKLSALNLAIDEYLVNLIRQ